MLNKWKRLRAFEFRGVGFLLCNYTPRRNEFEKGLKYQLFFRDGAGGYFPTSWKFETLEAGREWAKDNYFVFL